MHSFFSYTDSMWWSWETWTFLNSSMCILHNKPLLKQRQVLKAEFQQYLDLTLKQKSAEILLDMSKLLVIQRAQLCNLRHIYAKVSPTEFNMYNKKVQFVGNCASWANRWWHLHKRSFGSNKDSQPLCLSLVKYSAKAAKAEKDNLAVEWFHIWLQSCTPLHALKPNEPCGWSWNGSLFDLSPKCNSEENSVHIFQGRLFVR